MDPSNPQSSGQNGSSPNSSKITTKDISVSPEHISLPRHDNPESLPFILGHDFYVVWLKTNCAGRHDVHSAGDIENAPGPASKAYWIWKNAVLDVWTRTNSSTFISTGTWADRRRVFFNAIEQSYVDGIRALKGESDSERDSDRDSGSMSLTAQKSHPQLQIQARGQRSVSLTSVNDLGLETQVPTRTRAWIHQAQAIVKKVALSSKNCTISRLAETDAKSSITRNSSAGEEYGGKEGRGERYGAEEDGCGEHGGDEVGEDEDVDEEDVEDDSDDGWSIISANTPSSTALQEAFSAAQKGWFRTVRSWTKLGIGTDRKIESEQQKTVRGFTRSDFVLDVEW
jgi:hypothetical protein